MGGDGSVGGDGFEVKLSEEAPTRGGREGKEVRDKEVKRWVGW